MQVILHIGMHKTGSSSIQASLNGYDDGSTFYASLRTANHSFPFYSAFSSDHCNYRVFLRQGLSKEQIAEMRAEDLSDIERALKTAERERVVFSGEDISVLSSEDTERMLAFLMAYASSILVIGYVRDPIGFARSALQQLLRGGETGAELLQKPDYRGRFETFIKVLGADRIVLRRFDKDALAGGNVVDDFVQVSGLDPRKVKPIRRNESISLEAQRCLFALNRSSIPTTGDQQTLRARQTFIRVLDSVLQDTAEVPERYLLDCVDHDDLAWLRQATGIDFAARLDEIDAVAAPLEECLAGVEQETLDALELLLEKNRKPNSHGGRLIPLLSRVYCLCLNHHYDSKNQVFLGNSLEESDAEQLQSIAMKYESGESIDKDEALYLMRLAKKARPSGRLAREKLTAWGKGGAAGDKA